MTEQETDVRRSVVVLDVCLQRFRWRRTIGSMEVSWRATWERYEIVFQIRFFHLKMSGKVPRVSYPHSLVPHFPRRCQRFWVFPEYRVLYRGKIFGHRIRVFVCPCLLFTLTVGDPAAPYLHPFTVPAHGPWTRRWLPSDRDCRSCPNPLENRNFHRCLSLINSHTTWYSIV